MGDELSFLWHDYETFGASPSRDRPAQFAAIRTDAQLNEIGEPINLYCKPPRDVLPSAEACLITGISPQHAEQHGLIEAEFAARIEAEMARPNTVAVGYNSIRFDDEVTRFMLWRNLQDPYAREWRNGCSRWDLLDVVRCTHALRPEGIVWPQVGGAPSFKLEELAKANGLLHEQAHDALSDVRATIGLARLIRQAQPKLFDYCLGLRFKQRVAQELGLPTTLAQARPFLHVSGMFSPARGCLAVMWPLAMHPSNANELLAWDLAQDPSVLAQLDVAGLRERLFTPTAELPEGVARLPIKGVHLNKSPIVIRNLNTLSPAMAAKWGLDVAQAARHADALRALPDMSAIWPQVYAREPMAARDADEDLYGGFVGDEDRRRLADFRKLSPERMAQSRATFDDGRLTELAFRFRARNFPHTLSGDEQARWLAHCADRLVQGVPGYTTLAAYFDDIDARIENSMDDSDEPPEILSELYEWGEFLGQAF
jgi:exodeoxyribonuclease-1